MDNVEAEVSSVTNGLSWAGVSRADLELHNNVSTRLLPPSEARSEVRHRNKSAYLRLEANVRLKGENSVAMGIAHRLVSKATPSLKDVHRLRLFFFKYPSAYAPSELDALAELQPRGEPRG